MNPLLCDESIHVHRRGIQCVFLAAGISLEQVEDALRAKSPDAYRAIEDAMDDLKGSIKKKDAVKAAERFKKLQDLIQTNGL